jgi:formyltetrahydrofolate-dependent phosphoribosylglycinamide formyltransferase
MKLLIFCSGGGTNFQEVINFTKRYPEVKIEAMICNKKRAYAIQRAHQVDIPVHYVPWFRKQKKREEYDRQLVKLAESYEPDYILLLGWMHIMSVVWYRAFPHNTLNLHPSLPNTHKGAHGIEDTFEAFQRGESGLAGAMIHKVVEEIDSGEVLGKVYVEINKNDTLQSLKTRINNKEKVLVNYIMEELAHTEESKFTFIREGKVRDILDLGYGYLGFYHSNRLSSFDRHICDIEGKGFYLNKMSEWWMNQTRNIVPNHLVWSDNNLMVGRETTPFKVEVVVRGYITGSTKTSLWTHYAAGERKYCGIKFREGLVKNQRLKRTVITPTTKGETDEPLSAKQIVERGLMTQKEWDYVSEKALELFKYGQYLADKQGFILVDTKYEFGKTEDGQIMLIDELHTCDSSRYWVRKSYKQRFAAGEEPERLDKDVIRVYLREVMDNPYEGDIPEIPDEMKFRLLECYKRFYENLTSTKTDPQEAQPASLLVNSFFSTGIPRKAVILSGSPSDGAHVKKLQEQLDMRQIYSESYIASAHKTTRRLLEILEQYENDNVIWITVAGMSNALSGVVAGNTTQPVIACPPFSSKEDMMINIHSTLQCPSNVPVLTVLKPGNVALCCKRIFNSS